MTNTPFALDDIRAAADRKYGSFLIQISDEFTVELRNPLRLAKADRARMTELQELMTGGDDESGERPGDVDEEAVVREMVQLLASTRGGYDRLAKEIGDDMALWTALFEHYVERTQAGEASGSRD